MGRVSDWMARPSAWLGALGVVLVAIALCWSIAVRLAPPAAASCPELRPSGSADRIRIIDVGAAELELRGGICLVVDNVVSETALRGARAGLAAAQADLAAAGQAFAAAAAPPPPVPSWQRRYGVTAPGPAALAERRVLAAARRDLAQRRAAVAAAALAALTADRKLALFLDGERAPVAPRMVRGLSQPQAVTFALSPDARASAEEAGYWRRLLGPRGDGGAVPVTVGIGEEGGALPAATIRATPARNGGTSQTLAFRVYRPAILWLAAIGLALTLIGSAGLAGSTALLRDGRSRYSRYSLARVQMAWWFALTIAGFAYVWLVTGRYLDIVGSATFVLLGIAGATAGAARAVEGPRTGAEPLSRGFAADIGGGERIEMHRLQMIAWTIVLGGIYAWNVLVNFALTDFDANLLALAGVVNGVYVGLKTQEAA